jgi:anti-sigma factor RsiW
VGQRLSGEISSSSERELKSHLATCGICAAEARSLDPTLLFVPLGILGASAAAAPSAEDVRRVADDVLAEVRRRMRVSTPAPARTIFSRRFLQAAALVALAAGVFGVSGVRRAWERATLSAGLSTGLSAGTTPTAAPDAETASASEIGSESLRPSARPLIQDLKNPAARVYEFAAVSAKEPSVVFIADPHADI